MSGSPDVAIVGAGMGGVAAAVAARRAGASVTVFEAGVGATGLSGGGWDLASELGASAGAVLRPPRTVQQAVERIAREWTHHPYARVHGDIAQWIDEAHGVLLPALGYRELDRSGRGVLVASDAGRVRGAATAHRALLDLAELSGTVAVAVPEGSAGLDASFLAASLQAMHEDAGESGRVFRALELPLGDAAVGTGPSALRVAQWIDTEAGFEALASSLEAALRDAAVDAVLLPPMLGLEYGSVVDRIAERIGRPVGELTASLAGLQGFRLQRHLEHVLQSWGCNHRAQAVEHVSVGSGQVELSFRGGGRLEPAAVVLATGKHVGGGLVVEQGRLREPLAGLPIWADGRLASLPSSAEGPDPEMRFGTDLRGGGPGYRHGAGYDGRLRALGWDGEPVSERLFVAGALLDGVDPARDGTGLGCCATTGWVAGTEAAETARGGARAPS